MTMDNNVNRYKQLLNADGIRGTLRRQFTNSWPEVIAELLQNSQRAEAGYVSVKTNGDVGGGIFDGGYGFVYEDNGRGLDSVDAFHTLLKLAESDYDPEVIEQQHPMGVGFHSLLAMSAVTKVVIESCGYKLAIDTERWWSDREYYTTWYERVEATSEYVNGLRLVVSTAGVQKDIYDSFQIGRAHV